VGAPLAMDAGAIVSLAQGVWRGGVQHREAEVRALTGADEILAAGLAATATPAERATALIAATTRRIGEVRAPAREDARALSTGDRERLLLALYGLSFGPRIDVSARCAEAGCAAVLEMELAVEDLLDPLPPARARRSMRDRPAGTTRAAYEEVPIAGPLREITIAASPGPWRVQCRLPNGGDQEEAARLVSASARAAGDRILERCIARVSDANDRAVEPGLVLPVLRAPLAEALRRLDPQADTRLRFECPACGAESTAVFDAIRFVAPELGRADGIFVEVDRLARTYHWSEAEILALPVARRRRYLALLAGS